MERINVHDCETVDAPPRRMLEPKSPINNAAQVGPHRSGTELVELCKWQIEHIAGSDQMSAITFHQSVTWS
jgi:hypothetical protein